MDISNICRIVKEYAEKKDTISDSEIISLAKQYYPKFNSSFKNIFISMLLEEKAIYSYDLNVYKAYHHRKSFLPYQNATIEKSLSKYVNDKQIKLSYFDTSFYNSLSSLQSVKNYLVVGIESFAINYIMDRIEKDNKQIINSGDLAKLRKLFSGINLDFDYVAKLITFDTPLFKKINNIFYYPKLETLLVDLLTDKFLSDLYSSEIVNIYTNAFKIYAIKINTLLRYADKKGAKEKIISLLEYIDFNIKKGEFNND